MARLEFARLAGSAALAVTLLLGAAASRADTSGSAAAPAPTLAIEVVATDAATAPDTYLPVPRTMTPEISSYRVAMIALGTVAGAIVGNVLTGGLMTPVLTAGLAGPGTAAATSGAYAVGAITTTFFAGIGAYIGLWAGNPPGSE
jgi:hypothetical protein